MELSLVILKQITQMFIYMMIGYFLYRKKLVTKQGSKELGTLLLYVVLPIVIVKSYLVTFSMEMLRGIVLSFLASSAALFISVVLSKAVFKGKHPVEQFSSAFSNAGFIGIPLVEMTFKDPMAIVYVSSFVAILNILQWTWGIMVMTGRKDSIALRKIVTNPIIISFLLGILLFIFPVELPGIVNSAISAIACMNAPIAMIILGIYFAQIKLKNLFTDKTVYLCTFMRLIVIPVVTIVILAIIPGNKMLKISLLIAAATLAGSNVAIFAQREGVDYTQAVKDISLSTLLSIVTIPMVVSVSGLVF